MKLLFTIVIVVASLASSVQLNATEERDEIQLGLEPGYRIDTGANYSYFANEEIVANVIELEPPKKTTTTLAPTTTSSTKTTTTTPLPPELLVASSRGAVSEVRGLLAEDEEDANQVDHNGLTPLHVASRDGRLAVVQLLVLFGAKVSSSHCCPSHFLNLSNSFKDQFAN